ncbi:MAG: hypothetical protein M1822_002453 [Bathelium mastoideum]|nr:MAG: hypothetical protein M1822_002453 [Bathelium mastoideum]
MSMITATTWVRQGFAARYPVKYDFDEDEFNRISKLARLKLDDAKEDLAKAQEEQGDEIGAELGGGVKVPDAFKSKPKEDDDDDLREYDMEHYDDDDGQDRAGEPLNMLGNVRSLVYHESNSEDPYITIQQHEEEDDEREELEIIPTDNLILAGRIEDEVAHLEVYVYEDEADNLYVHHDIMLPSIPLAVEWVSLPPGYDGSKVLRTGKNTAENIAAIGMMEPDIELWDIDTVDCMYPHGILGPTGFNKDKAKKKKIRKGIPNDKFHVDAVLSLASNRQHRNLLLSASADTTIKLWDLNVMECAHSYEFHTDKVASVAWSHGTNADSVFLTGSYDRNVVLADARLPNKSPMRWRFNSDVEKVQFDPHDVNMFYVNTEDGAVHYYDSRQNATDPKQAKPVWRLQAHDESISSFDVNPIIPGFLVTGSSDKTVKLWNVESSGPSMVVSRDVGVGKIFSTQFAPDSNVGFRLAVAGSKGSVQIWDTSTNAAVRRIFGSRVAANGATDAVKERMVAVDDSGDDSEEDEGNDEEHDEIMEE